MQPKNPTAVAELTIMDNMEAQENIHLQFLHQEENFVRCWIVTYLFGIKIPHLAMQPCSNLHMQKGINELFSIS